MGGFLGQGTAVRQAYVLEVSDEVGKQTYVCQAVLVEIEYSLTGLLAMELSIPLVNFHPPSGFVLRHHLNDELAEHVRTYRNMVNGSGIILTIENLPTIRTFRRLFVNRFLLRATNNMYQIAEFARDNDIHVTFDTTHIGTSGVDLLDAYAVFRDRIENIHLSDYDGRWQHLLPGTGYLPLERLLAQVRADGYNGTITLETCPAAMEDEDKAKAQRNAEAGLRYIKDHTLTYEPVRNSQRKQVD